MRKKVKADIDTSERAASRRMRLDKDLEPGKLTVPEISLMGCNVISGAVEGFSAAAGATEARALKTGDCPPTFPLFKDLKFNEKIDFDRNVRVPKDLG